MWLLRQSGYSSYRWAGAALLLTASTLPAQYGGRVDRVDQGRALFEWKGRVDREVRITMRGRDAWIQSASRTDDARRQPVVARALPREDGNIRVRLEHGRGDVDVVQQPSRRNNYTAIVRVQDRSSGSDTYRLTAYWVDSDYASDDRPGRPSNGNAGGWDRGGDRFDRTVLRWSGRVDDGLEIRIHDNRIEYRNLSGKGTRDVHAEFTRLTFPRDAEELRVQSWTGRGDVIVVQQPTARNDYTAVIRVRDPQPSYGFYDFELAWQGRYTSRR